MGKDVNVPIDLRGHLVMCNYESDDHSRIVFAPVLTGTQADNLIDYFTHEELRELADAMQFLEEKLSHGSTDRPMELEA